MGWEMRKMGSIRNDYQLNKAFKIGNTIIENPVIVAPMAGATDHPYRKILTEFSPGLICGEMVSAKGILHNNNRTKKIIKQHNEGVLYSQQLFGSDPEIMAEAAKSIEEYGVDILDINMGCPAPKIVKNGDGAALLRQPDLAAKIVNGVVAAVNIPVTVKIRTGFDSGSINTVEISKIAQESGAQAVIIHGRTCEQQYSGEADWHEIHRVKERLDIPVIGNGDIFNPVDALDALTQWGCNGVMLGRGILGNPWLIERCITMLLYGQPSPNPSSKNIEQIVKKHFTEAISHYGEFRGITEMRKHISWYMKGLPNSTEIKDKIMRMNDKEQILSTISTYFASLSD